MGGVAGVLVSGVLMAAPAQAQSTQQAQRSGQSAQAGQRQVLEEIVITGSRVRRTQFEVLQPTVEMTLEYMDKRGFTNVADALNDMPGFGVAVSPIGDQSAFNIGQNFVNLFSLGSARTLTLVNSRRFVPGRSPSVFGDANPGLQVDLNMIPTAFIDRIDRIAVGGAPIYGADAIAGTINVVLRRRYEGAEADVQYGVSDRGDVDNYRVRGTVGTNFLEDRGNVALAVEYNNTKGILQSDRPRTAVNLNPFPNLEDQGPNDGRPGQILRPGRTIPYVTRGGIPLTQNAQGGTPAQIAARFIRIPDPNNPGRTVPAQFVNGRLVPYDPGNIVTASQAIGGQGLRLSDVSSLIAPVERNLAATLASLDVTDNVRWFLEGNYALTKNKENANQPVYNAPLFGGNGSGLTMSLDNPFLHPADRALIAASLPAGATTFTLSRGSFDLAESGNDSRRDTARNEAIRVVTGFDGSFDLLDRSINWELSYNRGETNGEFNTTMLLEQEFRNAIDAVRDANGNIVCRSRAPGCVPLNLFGDRMSSAAAIDYVSERETNRSSLYQESVEANFDTKLFSLPAGDVGIALGASWREEKGEFKPGDISRAGRARTAQFNPVSGGFISREIYGEALVPLVAPEMEWPLLYRVEVEAAGRRVNNSLAGAANTFTVGGRIAPIEDVTFRGNRTVSIRAPAITELFLPRSPIFTTGVDPCASRNINGGPNPAVRQANCRAELQRLGRNPNAPFVSRVETATVQGFTSGNTNLTNETANAWTVGFVFTPSFLDGFSAAVDWVDIEIEDAVVNLNASALMQVCYDSADFPSAACSRFRRVSAADNPATPDDIGQVVSVEQGYVNAGYTKFSGLTATAQYEFDLGAYGQFELSGTYYYINELETSITGLGFDVNVDAHEIGNSEHQFSVTGEYGYENVSLLVQGNYLSSAVYNRDFTVESRDVLEVDSYWRFDATLSYEIVEDIVARLAVNNVFDVEPPPNTVGNGGLQGLGVYDIIGRYWAVGLNAKF